MSKIEIALELPVLKMRPVSSMVVVRAPATGRVFTGASLLPSITIVTVPDPVSSGIRSLSIFPRSLTLIASVRLVSLTPATGE